MRTLLAAFSMMMLVGAGFGCGDDSTSTGGADMAVGLDMTAVAHDMSTLTCLQIFVCANNCGTGTGASACINQCIAEGKTVSKGKAQAVLTCAISHCTADGGVDTTCASNYATQAVTTGGGPCAAEGSACMTDTGM